MLFRSLATRMSQMEQHGMEPERLALTREIAEVTINSIDALRSVVQSPAA